ncbi:MAG: SPOR domain-containing protein [Pseudomonadota bacterium]
MSRAKSRSEFDFGPYEDEYRGFGDQDEQARGPLILVLALGVLLIFAGVVWNTYRQGVRPAEGGLPVFADETTDFKRAPDERGGTQVAGLERGFYELMETSEELRGQAPELDGGVSDAPATETEINEIEVAESPIRVAAMTPEEPDPVAPAIDETPVPTPDTVARFQSGGAFQVQLMALRSEEAATKAWRDFNRTFPRLASGAKVDIQEANLGARGTFYRLRLGNFASREHARDYCEELKANGRDCIVVSRQS